MKAEVQSNSWREFVIDYLRHSNKGRVSLNSEIDSAADLFHGNVNISP